MSVNVQVNVMNPSVDDVIRLESGTVVAWLDGVHVFFADEATLRRFCSELAEHPIRDIVVNK